MSELKSAFVTGAGGFIGRHLVRQLLKENVQVTALMMKGEPIPEGWGDNVKTVTGDVRRLVELEPEIGAVDAIFHLAAVVGDWGARQEHIDITVKGTEQAIELALAWDAHFVVTTSVCAYASVLAKGKLDETDAVGIPSSPYEFCKQEQERVTKEAVARGLKASIIRPGNVFGVESGPWVNTLLGMMREEKPCMVGNGDWDAGLVNVHNLVAMLIAAARSKSTGAEIYNAADGFGITWKEYMPRLAKAANVPAPKSVPLWLAKILAPTLEWLGHVTKRKERPLMTRQSFRLVGGPNEFSIAKAERELGYRPVMSFDDSMKELEAYFAKNPNNDT